MNLVGQKEEKGEHTLLYGSRRRGRGVSIIGCWRLPVRLSRFTYLIGCQLGMKQKSSPTTSHLCTLAGRRLPGHALLILPGSCYRLVADFLHCDSQRSVSSDQIRQMTARHSAQLHRWLVMNRAVLSRRISSYIQGTRKTTRTGFR